MTAGNKQMAVFDATLVVVWYFKKNNQFVNVLEEFKFVTNKFRSKYRMSIKSFADYKHLLQENYVTVTQL